MPALPVTPTWLKADSLGKPVGVDTEKKIIHGYVVAQLGPFKSEGRGEFDKQSLNDIVRLYGESPAGIKSRFAHPTLSDDGIGKFLGRSRDGRLDGDKVRADLHLDPTSFRTPSGDLGGYVMALAQSDAGAFSSSLVLMTKQEIRLNEDGTPKKDDAGKALPPLWRPTRLHASDVVDTGDAVDDFLAANLSAEELPDALVRRGSELLNQAFPGQPRDVVQARLQAWLDKYLQLRYGPAPGRTTNLLKKKLRMQERAAR
jgi:hypothetical protein